MKRMALLASGCALLVLARPAAAQPTNLSLEVSPTTGTVADTFVVTVRIDIDGVSGAERYLHPEFPDFSVLDTQRKQSTSMRYDAGRGQTIETSELRRYFLQPKTAGKLRIGPARIKLGGKDYETRQVVVTVRPGPGAAVPGATDPRQPPAGTDPDPTAARGVGVPGFVAPDPRGRDDMFLYGVADRKEAYVGEQVVVTWLLYTRAEVLKFDPRPPRLDGLWSETLYAPDSYFTYHDVLVGRTPYVMAVVSKRAIFPTRPGKLEVRPYEARVSSLSTPLGRPVTLRSEPLFIQVKPLPEGAPPGFVPSYVGEFSVEAKADRTEIDASQSLTLTVTVTAARGAIRRTRAPELSFPGFAFRQPRDYVEKVETDGEVVGGHRIYRYWTTPRQGGQQVIPPIEVPYFNPRTGRYEVARSAPLAVMVRGDPSEIEKADASNARENLIERDIGLIRGGSTISSRESVALYRSPWFWMLAALPPFGFVLVVVTDRVRRRLKRETPRSRLRRARGRARQRFRVAEIHIRGNRPAKFFGELAHVLYDYIEERVRQPVQSMTRDEMRELLHRKGFAGSTIRKIDDSLESFDFARFAPSAAGPEEMREALRRTRELLRLIEQTRLSAEGEETTS